MLFLTAKDFEWPNLVLERKLYDVMEGKKTWNSVVHLYDEAKMLSKWAFEVEDFPVCDLNELERFHEELVSWNESNSFSRPCDYIQVFKGRPVWDELLPQLAKEASNVADTFSNVPDDLISQYKKEGFIQQLDCLYTGTRNVLDGINRWVSNNNKDLFARDDVGTRLHWVVHPETW